MTVGVQFGRRADDMRHDWGLHGDGYTVIEAPDEEAARKIAFAVFGMQWAFLYDRAEYPDFKLEQYHPAGEELRIAFVRPSADTGAEVNAQLDDLADAISNPASRRIRETTHAERDRMPGHDLDEHSDQL